MKKRKINITGFLILDGNGNEIEADAHGCNLAVNCFYCDHPLLLIARKNQRGWDEEHAAECKGCGEKYFLDTREHMKKLHVFCLSEYLRE